MVVELDETFRPASLATVAVRALALSLTRQAGARQATVGDGDAELIWVGQWRNLNRGPRYLPPHLPSDVS